MKTFWTVAVLLVSAEGSLIEFGRMIKEETGKTAFPSYTFYGCYCGLGGKGRPRDATDRCCLMHDCCYENLTDCHTKTDPYDYSRKNGVILCVLVFASANLIQFGWIIEHLTGRHALIYNGYGCYCGWGGSRQPVDATDWCCRVHDCCYQALSLRRCKPKMEKYFYSVGKDTITCARETECRRQTCECDKAAALCFRRSMFQDRYITYPNILCQGPTPPCQGACHRKGGLRPALPSSGCPRGP